MRRMSGAVLSGIFAMLGIVHAYWALGGRRGWKYVLPTQAETPVFTPSSLMTWAVACTLFGATATTLGYIKVWGRWLPYQLFRWGLRGIGLAFLLRAVGDFRLIGFGKTVTGTPFADWDTRLFSPLCLTIAALTALADQAPDNEWRR